LQAVGLALNFIGSLIWGGKIEASKNTEGGGALALGDHRLAVMTQQPSK
jgi:hypothetical protein